MGNSRRRNQLQFVYRSIYCASLIYKYATQQQYSGAACGGNNCQSSSNGRKDAAAIRWRNLSFFSSKRQRQLQIDISDDSAKFKRVLCLVHMRSMLKAQFNRVISRFFLYSGIKRDFRASYQLEHKHIKRKAIVLLSSSKMRQRRGNFS